MTKMRGRHQSSQISLILLMAVQALCAGFFLWDLIEDYKEAGASASVHLSLETLAALSLLAAIAFEARYLAQLLTQKAELETNLRHANAAMHEVISEHFRMWRLSPSETDVATFLVKGLDISEIAQVRGCAEGTVKAHLNAIYRKSDTRNRGELLSTLIDSVMGDGFADTTQAYPRQNLPPARQAAP